MGESWVAAGLALLLASVSPSGADERFPTMASARGRMPCGSCAPPREIPSRSVIAPPSEPGERLVLSGDLYEADGTRGADLVLFVYHTDASGLYNRPNDVFNPRLYGWVRTDRQGHYELETIRPGAYPSHSEAAHIHAHVFGAKRPEWFIEEFRFADDPLLPQGDRDLPAKLGRFSPVVGLARGSDGVWRGTRDIRLGPPRHP